MLNEFKKKRIKIRINRQKHKYEHILIMAQTHYDVLPNGIHQISINGWIVIIGKIIMDFD